MKVIIANTNYVVKVNPPFLAGGGGDGNGIVSITQPEPLVLRIETNDFTENFTLYAGTNGTNGNTILSGSAHPNDNQGVPGDFYLRTSNYELFGPKVDGHWSANGVIIKGRTLLNGTNVPNNSDGAEGDFFLRTTNSRLYGPKVGNDWGAGVSLIGATGATGATGADGNGITSITQPTPTTLQVATRDFTNTFNLPIVNPIEEINLAGYIDHLEPTNLASSSDRFGFATRSAGTGSFRNTFTLGLGGQIQLTTGGNAVADVVIRGNGGLSGYNLRSEVRNFICGVYFDTLFSAAQTGTFVFAIQNDINPTTTPANRTGIYVRVQWNAAVGANTLSLETTNNTLTTTITDTLPIVTGTVYAIQIKASTSGVSVFLNGVARPLLVSNTNLPIFAAIQPSVGLTKATGTTAVIANVDFIATYLETNSNIYTIA